MNGGAALKASIFAVIAGVIIMVVGLSLAPTILSQAATAGANTNTGSFSGTQSLNDLVPLIYYAIVIFLGISLIGAGGFGVKRSLGS